MKYINERHNKPGNGGLGFGTPWPCHVQATARPDILPGIPGPEIPNSRRQSRWFQTRGKPENTDGEDAGLRDVIKLEIDPKFLHHSTQNLILCRFM